MILLSLCPPVCPSVCQHIPCTHTHKPSIHWVGLKTAGFKYRLLNGLRRISVQNGDNGERIRDKMMRPFHIWHELVIWPLRESPLCPNFKPLVIYTVFSLSWGFWTVYMYLQICAMQCQFCLCIKKVTITTNMLIKLGHLTPAKRIR